MRNFWIILLFILPWTGFAQVKNTGIPKIHNYPKSEYNAGTQNWAVAQDPDGFLYFANNDGLLRFDGVKWTLFDVPGRSPVRSVCVDKKGTVYIGLDDDFGVYETNSDENTRFRSLKSKLPSDFGGTGVIWKIYETQFGIVFQSYQYIFIYREGEISTIRPQKAFSYSFYVNNRLFFHEPGVGLFELINGFVNKVPWADELINSEILSIVSFHDNQLLIGTAQDGWFYYSNGKLDEWDVPVNDLVGKYKLFCAVKTDENHLAIGTILNGILIVTSDGKVVQQINRAKGLQNNTILSEFLDNSGNLWLGLDNGIDYIELNSPLSYITSYDGISTGYCCIVNNDNLYLGTNQGLFVKPFNAIGTNTEEGFELIKNTEGQVWSLEVINNQLVCGHHFGTFIIDGTKARKMSEEPGGWKYIQLSEDSTLMVGGHYNGLVLFQDLGSGWKFKTKIKNFSESSRFLTQDEEGNLWMSHGSKGVFRIQFSTDHESVENMTLYNSAKGLPSVDQNLLMEINKNWYISTTDGLYQYNKAEDRFEKNEELNTLFDLRDQIKFVAVDDQENLWYIAGKDAGLLHKNDDFSYSKIAAPFSQLSGTFVGGFEFLYVLGNDNVFFGIEDGFAHYSSRIVTSYNVPFRSFITKVEVPYLDSVIYPKEPDLAREFPFNRNAFRFYFAAPFFQNPGQLQFSYFIDNYSESWSPWSPDNYRDITNLPENEYVFRVKAQNAYGAESDEAQFSFVITPPWYRSLLARYIYLLFFILLIIAITWIVQRRFERSKQRERRKHEKELKKTEKEFQQQSLLADKEIIRLKNEKLEAEKIYLDKELANQTLSLVQKNKFLLKINQELKQIADQTADSSVKTKMVVLKKRIDREIDGQQQKKIFESYFEEVHADFFARLKEHFPQLSPKDLRLCAYIRMNISTKEIATLMNISDRGVEISRYRLRKKMELSRDVNLSTFLLNI
ncbi:triple tyrosine motif-containing protein [Maribellus sp. YY47]|uniref:ligand-binding sensor domain-containing protein n=1 Tax=Maribellus sp. YY47 TaxID=2929486 RepID=UPI0020006F95|nr:triple tyrosine motif-containing protein [Maribellus sp. YY47]MCK3686202.1 hypothetical protein [Maribellus sp. YY47]